MVEIVLEKSVMNKIIKIQYFISLFLAFAIHQNVLSQSNTVIILFEENDTMQGKKIAPTAVKDNQDNDVLYQFHLKKFSEHSTQNILRFRYSKYADFDNKFANNQVLYLKVAKSFFKKNKDIIITKRNLDEMGYDKALKLFKNTNKILLIDKSDFTNKHLILKEVLLSDPSIE